MNDETNGSLIETAMDIVDVTGSTIKAIEKIEKTGTGKFIGRVLGEVVEWMLKAVAFLAACGTLWDIYRRNRN